jgi:hypothetical protein
MRHVVWLVGAIALTSCGHAAQRADTTAAPGGTRDQSKWPADDGSLCERFVRWKGNPELVVTETAGPGSLRPNVRRVFKVAGDRDSRHTVVLCREIDTNLDGLKDVVRTFNEKGEPLHEESDTNFDGKIDVWLNFADGRIAEEDVDTTLGAGTDAGVAGGRPNEWKFYVDGHLSRIRKNTHCPNGKPDVWEIYYNDRLERVGTDSSCDGHVDRWDRDAQLLASEEAAQSQAADGGAGSGTGSAPVTVTPQGDITDGGAHAQGDAGVSKRPPR